MQTKSHKKSIFAILVATIFVLAQFVLCMPFFAQKNISTYADNSELKDYAESVTVSNSNFADFTGSTFPKSPSSWTKTGNSSIKSGVIDVSTKSFEKNREDYGLANNPESSSSSDNYVLMLNAEENASSLGYKSSSLTLEANSHYTISFSGLTQSKNNNGFSAYIVGNEIENSALNSFINIQTGIWNNFTFYITTGLDSIDVSLELWLGAKANNKITSGAVFFDNVKAQKYTETAFKKLSVDSTTSKSINLQQESLNLITNGSFEDGIEGFTRLTANGENAVSGIVSLSTSGFDTLTTKIENAPSTNMINAFNGANNQRGLFINNLVETKTGYKTAIFKVDRFEIVGVSIWVKTGKLSSNGASLKIAEVVDGDDEINYSSEFTNIDTSTYSNKFSNDWANYTFYIKGNAFEPVNLELQLWVGSESNDTRGYAFFDEIRTFNVTTKQFANASEGTYLKKLNLSNLESLDIANGAFNETTDAEKIDGVYEPSSWTLSSESGIDSKYSGVINTKTEYFNIFGNKTGMKENPGVLPNPYSNLGVDEISNNVLMIYNPVAGDQTFKSSDFSLSADTNYKVTFFAKVGASARLATVKILNNSNIIASFDVASNEWTQYTFYVKNGKSTSIAFALSLGSEYAPETGCAFFDNFLSETIEDDVYEMQSSANVKIADLSEENFLTTGEFANDVYTPYLWEGKNNATADASIIAGILNKNNSILPFDIAKDENAKTDNSLVIFSPNDTYYSFIGKTTYTFNASSYYKVEVVYKTYNIGQDEANKQLDEDKNAIDFGAFIELTGLNLKSVALTDTNDEWKTFTFYVKTSATETTSAVKISLGDSNALTKGGLAVANLKVIESTQDEYDEVKDDILANVGVKADLSDGSEPEQDSEDEETSKSGSNFGMIDIATIIIVVSIVIAFVGICIKQFRKRKKTVKTTIGKYDRNFNSKVNKPIGKVEDRLQEVEAELARLNEVINILTKTQNNLIVKREMTIDSIENEKLLKQIDKINKELAYELDNRDSVLKEQKILKSMLEK